MTMQRTTSFTNRTTSTAASWSPNKASVPGFLQRQCACGTHTMGEGECAGCAKKKSGLQKKLTIGASNDPLEREADRVAEQVVAAPAHSYLNAVSPRIQRVTRHATGQTDLAPASVDRVLASPGRPLEPALQQEMGQRFSYDFSRVRVHTDAAAEQSARDVNAHAYTVGHQMVFGAGRYAPRTHEGRRLIAHELTHVIQQSQVNPLVANTIPTLVDHIGTLRRQTDKPNPAGLHPEVIGDLKGRMLELMSKVDPVTRNTLIRNKTIAIGLVEEVDAPGVPRYVYTVNQNWTNPSLKKAADDLNLTRWDPVPAAKGRGAVGAPGDAEQLLLDADPSEWRILGVAVSREACKDCQVAIATSEHQNITVIEVKMPPLPESVSGGGTASVASGQQETRGEITGEPTEVTKSVGGGGPEGSIGEDILAGESKAGRFAARLGSVVEIAGPFVDALLMISNYRHIGIDASAFRKLSAEKLQPIVDKELKTRSAEIAKVAQEPDAFYGVYANVRCELHYGYVLDRKGRSLGRLQLYDARFLSMSITAQNVNKADWNKERGRQEGEAIQDATVSIRIYVPQHPELTMWASTVKAYPSYQPTDPPLYFSKSFHQKGSLLPPQPMTIDALLRWARINHPRLFDDPNLSTEILHSQEFTGSQRAREKALIDLRRMIQAQKMLRGF